MAPLCYLAPRHAADAPLHHHSVTWLGGPAKKDLAMSKEERTSPAPPGPPRSGPLYFLFIQPPLNQAVNLALVTLADAQDDCLA